MDNPELLMRRVSSDTFPSTTSGGASGDAPRRPACIEEVAFHQRTESGAGREARRGSFFELDEFREDTVL